jgi:hypothetical protein
MWYNTQASNRLIKYRITHRCLIQKGATQFSTQTIPACGQTVMGIPLVCDQVGEIASSITTGSRITTGGGFSDLFSMPSYQKSLVNNYLQSVVRNTIPSQYYNSSNRAYPDISAWYVCNVQWASTRQQRRRTARS